MLIITCTCKKVKRKMRKRVDEWLEAENLTLIKGWRRDGLTYEQIAHNMGVHVSCLYKWVKEHDELKEAIKKGEQVMVYEVENAMYKAALGYNVTEVEETQSSSEGGLVTIKKKRSRHIPANVAAQIFILKNRRGDRWKEKQIIESRADGMLAELIDGLKEPEVDDIHEEAAPIDEQVAEEPTEEN